MQVSFPGWGLSLRRSPEEALADAVSTGVTQQELLDDLAGLSGDSYHTAASQQAAELSDADSLHTIVPACVLPARQHAPSGVDDVRRSASEASPAKAVKGADGVSPWAASRSHGRSHLLHLPPDVLDLVILQLHPRDWCALAAATKQMRSTVQSNELWRLCDPAYVRQQEVAHAAAEAASRRQAVAAQQRQQEQQPAQLTAAAKDGRPTLAMRRAALAARLLADGHSDGGDSTVDVAALQDNQGHGSQAEGQRIRKRRHEELRQRKQGAAGARGESAWWGPLSATRDAFPSSSQPSPQQPPTLGASPIVHPPAHLILHLHPQQAGLPAQQPAQPEAADGGQPGTGPAAGPSAAAPEEPPAAAEAAGITAQQHLGGWTRLYYPRSGPHGQHQALRAALSAAATAAPWLPRRLAQQFLHGEGVPSAGLGGKGGSGTSGNSSIGCGGGGAASRGSSRRAYSPAASVEEAFASAPGLQLLLAMSQAVSGQIGRRFETQWQTHDKIRIALCDLWTEGELTECSGLRRSITKLTRLSWSLTYEAVAAAFTAAADVLAFQLCTLTSHRMDGAALWAAVLAAWQHYAEWLAAVVPLMTLLSECISAERAAEVMARGEQDTPTLPQLGRIAFRSQVVLCYGLRGQLQAALLPNDGLPPGARGNFSQPAAALEPRILHLLLELDVPDDATRGRASRTRGKLRRVFGLEAGAAELTLGRRLRVPPL